jgi:Domain of unknown function (DUF1707)
MADTPDQMPAGGGDLRASHADRERVVGTLKAAFVQGRLGKDEFDLRVGQALASRTYAELAIVTADLPPGLAPLQHSQPDRVPGWRPVLRGPRLTMTMATLLYAGTWLLAVALPRDGEGDPRAGANLVGLGTLVYLLVMTMAGVWAQTRWRDRPD